MEDIIAELDTLLDLMREALDEPELPPRAAARVPEHEKPPTPVKGPGASNTTGPPAALNLEGSDRGQEHQETKAG